MKTLTLLFVLLAVPAAAQERGIAFDLSEFAVVVGHSMDLASTQRCLGSGRCHEVNPFLLRFDQPMAFAASKFGIGGVQLWATRKLQRSHPKWASVINYSIGAGFTALAVRNQRIGR